MIQTKKARNELMMKENEKGKEKCGEREWNDLEDITLSFNNGVTKQSGVERTLSRSQEDHFRGIDRYQCRSSRYESGYQWNSTTRNPCAKSSRKPRESILCTITAFRDGLSLVYGSVTICEGIESREDCVGMASS